MSFGTEVKRAGSRVWVLREDTEVRGFAAMRVRLREGYIMGFAIDPERQGRGLGGALLDEMMQFSRSIGLGRVDLHVSAANPAALALYESRGFRRSKHVPRFYGADEDAYVMSRRLRLALPDARRRACGASFRYAAPPRRLGRGRPP